MGDLFFWIIIGLPVFVFSGTVHEYMHAWTARKLGDYTATIQGRLTLNPLAHLDLYGTLLMIFARFGWMKPVPVNEYNFKKPVRDMALVAIAGPASNLVMAVIGAILFRVVGALTGENSSGLALTSMSFLSTLFYVFTWVNLALMAFNLLPIPPLDGYRIARFILKGKLRDIWEDIEKYSFIILLLLFLPFSPLSGLVGTYLGSVVDFLAGFFLF
ncbi:MAG: site-2 protease family protein [Candidatus Dojkabacteria bacterium]